MSKKYFSISILFVLTAFSINSRAQQPRDLGTLSLKECIRTAQDQSPVAKAARFALNASRWQYQSYQADLLPSFNISGDAPNFNRAIISNVLDDGSITFSKQVQSEASTTLSLNQHLWQTGGTLSLSSGLTRLGIFSVERTELWQSTPLVIGLRQPIFQFNSLKWDRRLEPLQYEIAQKQLVEAMEGLAETVTNGFFDVLLAKINLENAQFNVARNDSIYQISKGRYNVGSIAENDLLQSELALRNAEADLTRARLEYDRSRNEFKIVLGYPSDVTFDIKPPSDLPEINITVDKAKQLAIQNNSEALNYRLRELQADRDYAQAKSESGLSATLNANYGLNQTSESFSDLYQDPQNRQFITVGFEIPIFNWGKQRAQVNAARNQQREVANSIDYQRQRFYQEVDYTVSQFMQLKGQVQLAAKSDTIAQRRYDVAQNRYLIGKIDVTNLFIAQNEKDAARREYIRALDDFWSGWYSLRQLTLYNFQEDRPIVYDDYMD